MIPSSHCIGAVGGEWWWGHLSIVQEGLCCHGPGHGDGNRDGAANDVIPTSFYVDHLVLNSLFAFRNIFIGGFPSFYYLITANKIELFEIISRMLSQRSAGLFVCCGGRHILI